MTALPAYIDHAFRTVYYGGQHEKFFEPFIQRWGKPNPETLSSVLVSGSPEEKAIALFALGYSNSQQAKKALLPFLHSKEPMERWASALSLGMMKEEAALPVLIHLLDEFLPLQTYPIEKDGGLYHFWRMKAVNVLGNWNHREIVPALHEALTKSWEIEQEEQPMLKHIWHPYQDELLYALGRKGAFGVLTGFSLPSARRRIWMILLSCGFLRTRTRYGELLTQIQINSKLQQEVAGILEQRFGLTVQERTESIDNFAEDYYARMSEEVSAIQ